MNWQQNIQYIWDGARIMLSCIGAVAIGGGFIGLPCLIFGPLWLIVPSIVWAIVLCWKLGQP